MPDFIKKPEIIVFAGPNGSGKSTVTKYTKVIPPYINADDIKRATLCSDLEAAQKGYFIRCIYVITSSSDINVLRVKIRKSKGGHDVPEEKIRTRYNRCLELIPELIQVCDVFHLYDNTKEPFRIFKKRKTEYFLWENKFWSKDKIEKITGLSITEPTI